MKLNILKTDGTETGRSVELPESVFAIEPRDTLVYEDVRAYLAHQRQGTAKTKGRTEVRGGGKKAFRQKGTGGARRGTLRSPLLKGGGTVFGPRPRTYTIRLTKKMKELARKSAFTYKANDNAIMVVEDFSFDTPKTSSLAAVLRNLKAEGRKVLLLTGSTDVNLYKSGRNIPGVNVLEAYKPSTYEILHADFVLFTESGLNTLTNGFSKNEEAAA
ncbi:large subunit ribosomal protein L4 [Cyclonatronum proteinivorum]|uniref:Large ribosomal subunit protein uL4 n=1 Tax=Cyclonatronum proteinivorum TaxID=1457365 RepID=A0A345UHZ1_9BACT|nr:50S ribosomal protein L4 [Cyclonatronum proteinivorum]AXJ00093.1 large subunit ribosomal protein L4 [Cyclonatronum proteinivorum]